jgi:hypothetical protein
MISFKHYGPIVLLLQLVVQSSIRLIRWTVGPCGAVTQSLDCRCGEIEIYGRGMSTWNRLDNWQKAGQDTAIALALNKISAGLIARPEKPSQNNDLSE